MSKAKYYPRMEYQKLFDHMHDEHGLTLLESEMDEIISICRENDQQPLLDDFAKAAMQGIVASSSVMRANGASYGDDGYYPVTSLAKEAYGIAEAMMKERERRMNG